MVGENQPLVLHGKFIRHPKYGSQFEVSSMELDRQMDARGLANYLANNPFVKGIGPAKAKVIAEQFGSTFERSLIDEPEKIADVAHVPISVIDSLREHWLATSHVNQAMTALSAYGLSFVDELLDFRLLLLTAYEHYVIAVAPVDAAHFVHKCRNA